MVMILSEILLAIALGDDALLQKGQKETVQISLGRKMPVEGTGESCPRRIQRLLPNEQQYGRSSVLDSLS
jgi:hypothetical protein